MKRVLCYGMSNILPIGAVGNCIFRGIVAAPGCKDKYIFLQDGDGSHKVKKTFRDFILNEVQSRKMVFVTKEVTASHQGIRWKPLDYNKQEDLTKIEKKTSQCLREKATEMRAAKATCTARESQELVLLADFNALPFYSFPTTGSLEVDMNMDAEPIPIDSPAEACDDFLMKNNDMVQYFMGGVWW